MNECLFCLYHLNKVLLFIISHSTSGHLTNSLMNIAVYFKGFYGQWINTSHQKSSVITCLLIISNWLNIWVFDSCSKNK